MLTADRVYLCRYDLLRELEAELNLTVFPFIEVESRMENKVSRCKGKRKPLLGMRQRRAVS